MWAVVSMGKEIRVVVGQVMDADGVGGCFMSTLR